MIDAELTKNVDLVLLYQAQFVAPETDQTNHHGRATFEIEVTSSIDLDVSFVWDRIENPEIDSDGERPYGPVWTRPPEGGSADGPPAPAGGSYGAVAVDSPTACVASYGVAG